MPISINIPFDEILRIIKNLQPAEKQKIAEILMEETDISEEMWNIATQRKGDFEQGKISTESWQDLKKRLLN